MRNETQPAAEQGGRFRGSLLRTVLGPFLALGVVVLFFIVADSLQAEGGNFTTARNLRAVAVQSATVAVAALGMTVIIIAGGIDLSAGTALALCATVLAWCLKEDVALLLIHGDNVASATENLEDARSEVGQIERRISGLRDRVEEFQPHHKRLIAELRAEQQQIEARLPQLERQRAAVRSASPHITSYTPALAVLITLATGCLCGLANGALISYLRVVPFIVTLGTMTLYLGVGKIVANETTVRPDKQTQVPDWLNDFLSIRSDALWAGFPLGVWVALGLAAALAVLLHYTVFSRYVFALGSNEATARLCGINVNRTKLAVYTLAGFFIAMAGLYQFSRLSTGNPTSGVGLELRIIAAVVIGGGSLNGGRGSVVGTLTGAAIMAVIASGCTQLGLSNPIQDIILGVIIIAAVTVDQIRQGRLGQ